MLNIALVIYYTSFKVSPEDYGAVSTLLMFDSCETRQCTNITIMKDVVKESIESFFINLGRNPNLDSRIILDPDNGEVVITGNNGVFYVKTICYGLCHTNLISFS